MSGNKGIADADIDNTFDKYFNVVGRVAASWNHLQETLGFIFCMVTGTTQSVGFAIWYSTQSDRAQQEMLRVAIEASDSSLWRQNPKQGKEDALWLVNAAKKLTDSRNDAIHAPCAVAVVEGRLEMSPFYFYGNPRAKKLMGKDIMEHFAWYEAQARTLTGFGKRFQGALSGEGAWPQKPQMPSLTLQKTRKK